MKAAGNGLICFTIQSTGKDVYKRQVLTLYACRKDGKAVPDIACRLFAEVTDKIFYTDEDEFQIRFKDGTTAVFHLVTDAGEMKVQSNGMANFFSQAPLENEEVKDCLLYTSRCV